MLSQIPTSSPGELGAWLVALAGVVGIIVLILTGLNQYRQWTTPVLKPRRSPDEKFVTRAELKAICDQIDKHETYTHQRFHDVNNSIHAVTLKLESQPNAMRQMIDAAIGPLSTKIDRMAVTIAAIGARLNLPSADVNTDTGDHVPL